MQLLFVDKIRLVFINSVVFLHFPSSFLGLHPSKAKLELQKHLASLDNDEQASVFENTMVCGLFCLLSTALVGQGTNS